MTTNRRSQLDAHNADRGLLVLFLVFAPLIAELDVSVQLQLTEGLTWIHSSLSSMSLQFYFRFVDYLLCCR